MSRKTAMEHMILPEGECKRCHGCKKWQPLNRFNKDSSKWDNLNIYCRQCIKNLGGSENTTIILNDNNTIDKTQWIENNKKETPIGFLDKGWYPHNIETMTSEQLIEDLDKELRRFNKNIF